MDDLMTALEITIVGMGLVFAAIVLLWAVMALLVWLTAERKAVEEVQAEPEISLDELELRQRAVIAAVAVALAQEIRTKPHEFPLPPTASVTPWQAVMRGRQLKQRGPIR